MGENEIRERLTRIEVLLEELNKRMDGDERHRLKCYQRLDQLEEYVDQQRGGTAATDRMVSKIVSIVTIVNIMTLLVLKTVFHI